MFRKCCFNKSKTLVQPAVNYLMNLICFGHFFTTFDRQMTQPNKVDLLDINNSLETTSKAHFIYKYCVLDYCNSNGFRPDHSDVYITKCYG